MADDVLSQLTIVKCRMRSEVVLEIEVSSFRILLLIIWGPIYHQFPNRGSTYQMIIDVLSQLTIVQVSNEIFFPSRRAIGPAYSIKGGCGNSGVWMVGRKSRAENKRRPILIHASFCLRIRSHWNRCKSPAELFIPLWCLKLIQFNGIISTPFAYSTLFPWIKS